jgi:DNA-binding NtrC family response regulator
MRIFKKVGQMKIKPLKRRNCDIDIIARYFSKAIT